jgi:hypothetical protein
MVDGQRIHRVIGRESDGTTRTQAEEFIDKARQDAKAGRLNLPKGRKLALSFREAADKYLTKLEQEGGKDIPMKRYRLDQHLVPFFGDAPLSKIATRPSWRRTPRKRRASCRMSRRTRCSRISAWPEKTAWRSSTARSSCPISRSAS